MTSNKHTEPSWIVEGKYFYDPETKSNVLHELFDNEEQAMEFAAEKSRRCRSDSAEVNVFANVDGEALPIAKYKMGEEQFEKHALEMIIQDCQMFAEYYRKSSSHPLTTLLYYGGAVFVWALIAATVSHLFDDDKTGLIIGLFTATAAICIASVYLNRHTNEHGENHAAEAQNWARQVAYRVFTTDKVLLGRIFKTMRKNPLKKPILRS